MLLLSENLRAIRREKGFTQENAAELLGVSAQSVSKWERGDSLPDISMLPTLALLYDVSVDWLLGMDKMGNRQRRNSFFATAHELLLQGRDDEATEVYTQALKAFPSDLGFMSDMAMTLALQNDPSQLQHSVSLCERVLSRSCNEPVHHTTRAAMCYILLKVGDKDGALAAAGRLPHVRESREHILSRIHGALSPEQIDAALRQIIVGDAGVSDAQKTT